MRFLRDKAAAKDLSHGQLRAWFMFSEVKQTWLGFSAASNRGSGLGIDFARSLHRNLNTIFSGFGLEQITHGSHLDFYEIDYSTLTASRDRLIFLKDVIENKGGHRMFYQNDTPIRREKDLQILFRLTWFGTKHDVGREVNNGRGPVDFKVSFGAGDKTLVEFKLASNSQLKRNLENQLPVYKKASDAKRSLTAIIYFTKEKLAKVNGILSELGLTGHPDIVLIDARSDNKPSGSRA